MKVTINRVSLLKKLDVLIKVVTSTTVPAWECILAEIKEDKCYLSTRNDLIAINTSLAVVSGDEHSFCIPAKRLYDTLKLLKSEEVIFTTKQKAEAIITEMRVKGVKKKYSMSGIDPEFFQGFNPLESEEIKIPGKLLYDGISLSDPFIGVKDLREMLKGFSIQKKDKELYVHGGSQSSWCMVSSVIDSDFPDLLIPKELGVLSDSFKNHQEITLKTDKSQLEINTGDFSYSIILYNEKPAPVFELWDTFRNKDSYITVDRIEFIDALRRVSIYSSFGDNNRIVLDIKEGEMSISVDSYIDNASAEEFIDIKNNNVDELKIGFNALILTSVLTKIKTDNVKFFMTEFNKISFIEPDVQEINSNSFSVAPVLISDK